MRDPMPTAEYDLTEYAWLHTGPSSWSATDDEPSIVDVRHDDVPRVTSDTDSRYVIVDHREAFVLSLIDGTSTVGDLLSIAGLPVAEVLMIVGVLSGRGMIRLERRAA